MIRWSKIVGWFVCLFASSMTISQIENAFRTTKHAQVAHYMGGGLLLIAIYLIIPRIWFLLRELGER